MRTACGVSHPVARGQRSSTVAGRSTTDDRRPTPRKGWAAGHSAISGRIGRTQSSSSFFSATSVSVVSTSAAMEAALASAERVTFTGSITPSAIRSP